MKTPSDVLLEAADILGERGWLKHTLGDETGRLCAYGAIRVAAGSDVDLRFKAHALLTEYINVGRDIGHIMVVPHWNDYVCQSVEDVILGLKEAATR